MYLYGVYTNFIYQKAVKKKVNNNHIFTQTD